VRIHKILPLSYANGPGPRFVIWVQGCSRGCSECFNPETHDHYCGLELDITEILRQIPSDEVSGITVSGGEPFEQAKELAVLLEEAGRRGLSRLVYTGFTYEELIESKDSLTAVCLSLIDILIDGAYKKEILPDIPWTGSGNQRVLQLKHGKIRKVCGKNDIEIIDSIEGEIIIGEKGDITTTGIINLK